MKEEHMGSTNQNNSIHWFHLNAVQNRVLGNHLDNTKPIKPVLEMENLDFLPSPEDNQIYLYQTTALATRIVIKHIPSFLVFKDMVSQMLPNSTTCTFIFNNLYLCSTRYIYIQHFIFIFNNMHFLSTSTQIIFIQQKKIIQLQPTLFSFNKNSYLTSTKIIFIQQK